MLNLNSVQLIAQTIRGLSIDAINKANSGHPGLPLGLRRHCFNPFHNTFKLLSRKNLIG